MRGGLGWQKEDTHLLALHEPVRHELPRSDPASLVGHVDSLAMLLKALAALRSSTRSLPRSQLACWGKLPELFFGFLPNASTRDFYSSTPTREPTSISAAAGRNVGVSEMLDLEMFIWKFLLEKTRKSLSGSGFPPKSVHAVEGPKTRNLLSRVSHLVFFPREKNPLLRG